MTRIPGEFRLLLWVILLAGVTYGLLSPQPPKAGAALLPPSMTFWASKTIHVASYAILAGLAGWLAVRWRTLVCIWVFLIAHGATTEYLQQFVEGRSASVRDVILNTCGVTLGCAAVLLCSRLVRQADPAPSATTTSTSERHPQ